MGLRKIANVREMCDHISAAIKGQKPIIGITPKKYNLATAKVLHRSGFITILGLGPRRSQKWAKNTHTMKETIERLDLDSRKTDPSIMEAYDNLPKSVTGDNPNAKGAFGTRKLWIGLSMRKLPERWDLPSDGGADGDVENGPPPGKEFIMKSICSLARGQRQNLPLTMQLPGIKKLTTGFDVVVEDTTLLGLFPNESIVMGTSDGALEIREAKTEMLGGLMLCKVRGPQDWILEKQAPSQAQLREKQEALRMSRESAKAKACRVQLRRDIAHARRLGAAPGKLEGMEAHWQKMVAEHKVRREKKAKIKEEIKNRELEKLRKWV